MKFCLVFLALLFVTSSCEDYLDQAPEADISEKDAFGNFTSFQGFIEEMYNCVMDPDKGGAWNNYSFADENLNNKVYAFDIGNYWSSESYFFGKPNVNPSSLEGRDRRVWEWAWYAIRKANLALAKLDEEGLFEGTEEEKNHLKGQALFFRGWFYFELGRYWGGMPYVTRVLEPTENLTTEEFNRLTFQQMAEEMAKDFRAAADLLPNHWDESGPGQKTLGHNMDRINKFHALGYLGKALLYGASPMMNEEATGSNTYNAEMCDRAADAFGELLQLADQTGIYSLEPWSSYTDIFFRFSNLKTGGSETIMNPTVYNRTRIRWSALGGTVPSSFGLNSGSNSDVPTNNIIKNFAMANGLPIDDPNSGYDPNNPWEGREPRFYKTIVVDGDQFFSVAGPDREAQLYTGGRHRSEINPPSVTGYYCKKFNGMGPDFNVSKAGNLSAYVPYLRLSDVYLMYAEAVNFGTNGGPQSTSSNYGMTAEQAVNAIRNRGQLPDLDAKYTANRDVFFEEIVRERAVELLMEGARFCDLRRWNRNGDPRYLDKTAIDFDRGPDGKPINIRERVVIKRVAEKKHNWLPIPVEATKIYEGFPQNPGW
ncbi:MAG TPA: RagB/SusD family nutrient uptake outer membrane protein [Chryseosolibacter sp.]|jgi:tetratricopeptide (TPR) repeat protein|nr:RagB/SusD family nutrient uptake outer membrane protein [Chryseosolibacter sp.]